MTLLLRSAVLLLGCLFAAAVSALSTTTGDKHKKDHRGWVLRGHEVAEEEWPRFKRYFRKAYLSPSEEEHRFQVFQSSLAQAKARNAQNVAAGGEHVFGVTRFSDESQEEFNRRYKGRKGHGKGVREGVAIREPVAWTSARMEGKEEGGREGGMQQRPAVVDWVAAGATTSVGNQGQCGSCWAFSATSQIESAFIMAGNAPWRFSVQQITSCTADGFGCGGGDTIAAYEQLLGGETKTGMVTPGVVSASMAPYVESMYEECLSPRCTERCRNGQIGNLTKAEEYESLTGYYVSLSGWSYGTPPCNDACDKQDLELLKSNIAEYGPASICVNAESWGLYVDGVLMTDACGSFAYNSLDHCVNIVGYNDDAPEPYFMVRNSWSTLWGMDGHILLSSKNNTCGLANEVTFVSIAPQEEE